MDRNRIDLGTRARASPHNDAQTHRPKPVTSGLGLPCQVRARLKRLVPKRKFRFATWNIGSLTGRCRELADVLAKRRVQCAFLQETRWKGNKSRDIGQGYRLVYAGSPSGRNGVAVVLSKDLQDGLLEVDRWWCLLNPDRLPVGATVPHWQGYQLQSHPWRKPNGSTPPPCPGLCSRAKEESC
ncbi:hypothetical protein PYW07_009984 [Mythimna separata]|uniref:Endonuclease/exonuclease/phosphatase domain-containing protein n=1 Tax=Mythimna separata TaxID=271217 RepID=A0AAD8DQ56_MYTSE|nr:hypothetical protein PYW07_009984 [Mythimna separata]